MPDDELSERAADIRVYARVDPGQKIRIVRALQERGEFVAMTGDGVNDAPALKRADIGVAMGKGGTDVAREAASLVLLDDNFATIVKAVQEGRRIFDNIRKFIRYAMTGNSAEIWTIFLAPFLGLPIPLLPIHILWINLVTDGLPGLALAAEPAEKGVMQRPPRPPRREHLRSRHVAAHRLGRADDGSDQPGHPSVRDPVRLAALADDGIHRPHAVSDGPCPRDPLGARFPVSAGPRSNLPLLGAVALTFALQLATIYVPWLNPIFKTAPLTAGELAYCLAASSLIFAVVEVEKLLVRRGLIYKQPSLRQRASS